MSLILAGTPAAKITDALILQATPDTVSTGLTLHWYIGNLRTVSGPLGASNGEAFGVSFPVKGLSNDPRHNLQLKGTCKIDAKTHPCILPADLAKHQASIRWSVVSSPGQQSRTNLAGMGIRQDQSDRAPNEELMLPPENGPSNPRRLSREIRFPRLTELSVLPIATLRQLREWQGQCRPEPESGTAASS